MVYSSSYNAEQSRLSRFINEKSIAANQSNRPFKAAIVCLVRNRELSGIASTLKIFEEKFNSKFSYPYIFLNDEDFSDEFRRGVSEVITSGAHIEFGKVPRDHWDYPNWIDLKRAAETRERMKNIIYGASESYRKMCRYQSGFFYWHHLLDGYDYYWRLEPDTSLLCDIPYDPFSFMHSNGIKYGFTISFDEIPQTIPTLWDTTMEFMNKYRSENPSFNPTMMNFFKSFYLPPFLSKKGYNYCHFWSNFEIGSIRWLRSEEYNNFFNFLDNKGGFFYERWGDAPVHSLAVGLFLNRSEVHFFEDIGYRHTVMYQCPPSPYFEERSCDCERFGSADIMFSSCIPLWKMYRPNKWFK